MKKSMPSKNGYASWEAGGILKFAVEILIFEKILSISRITLLELSIFLPNRIVLLYELMNHYEIGQLLQLQYRKNSCKRIKIISPRRSLSILEKPKTFEKLSTFS